tara:strand:- start:372 stop:536 length:165 start_codon:yes stop_codon:yes gene_type:complete
MHTNDKLKELEDEVEDTKPRPFVTYVTFEDWAGDNKDYGAAKAKLRAYRKENNL